MLYSWASTFDNSYRCSTPVKQQEKAKQESSRNYKIKQEKKKA